MEAQPLIDATEPPDGPREERNLVGARISPGLAMGTAWVAGDILDCCAQALKISPDQIEAEMERIRGAFLQVRMELEESARRISEQLDPKLAEIFHAHQMMLDSFLSSR
ncbi:MAG TPA: phosphoenolpyruvate-utilizing N-terminal domain-containing protein, partial [Terrimicrobiaceae bacterium]|nr:phosphoenolpyruvate-utilizing N-terminal domain-containing protein [Terrimicrobiaceae bacterium]